MPRSALLAEEIAQRAGSESMYRLATRFGIHREQLYQIRNGASVGPRMAARLLAKIREDDLALADRIEAELVDGYRHDLRTER